MLEKHTPRNAQHKYTRYEPQLKYYQSKKNLLPGLYYSNKNTNLKIDETKKQKNKKTLPMGYKLTQLEVLKSFVRNG